MSSPRSKLDTARCRRTRYRLCGARHWEAVPQRSGQCRPCRARRPPGTEASASPTVPRSEPIAVRPRARAASRESRSSRAQRPPWRRSECVPYLSMCRTSKAEHGGRNGFGTETRDASGLKDARCGFSHPPLSAPDSQRPGCWRGITGRRLGILSDPARAIAETQAQGAQGPSDLHILQPAALEV